jgi:uncharacterized OB-fold protein
MFPAGYLVALIDLEEGDLRLLSNVEDCSAEEIYNGMPVEVGYAETANDQRVPIFRPVSGDRP